MATEEANPFSSRGFWLFRAYGPRVYVTKARESGCTAFAEVWGVKTAAFEVAPGGLQPFCGPLLGKILA